MAKLKGKQYLSETVSFRISDSAKHQLVTLKKIVGFDSEADFSREAFLRGLKVIDQEVSSFEPDIAVIGSKIEKGLDLTHDEIAYLAKQSHQAYTTESSYYNPKYMVDNLMAVGKLAKMVNMNDWSYAPLVASVLPYGKDLDTFLDESILAAQTKKQYNPEPASRLLDVYCSSKDAFEAVEITKLNEALKPYFKSLLILSKYTYHHFQPLFPAFHFDDYILFIQQNVKLPDNAKVPPNKKLKVQYKGENISMQVQVEPRFLMTILRGDHQLAFTFTDFLELRNLLNNVPEVQYTATKLPGSTLIAAGEDTFQWSLGRYTQILTLTDIAHLKKTIDQFAEEFQSFIDAMILQWGDL